VTGALVSVVIPAYNAGAFIEEALQSVLGQTYSNLEVIVVDDESTDDTRARVAAFGARVTLIPQANAGAAVARNTGIRYSHGKYLAFLDADDIWLPSKVARLVDALERSPEAGAAYHGYVAMDEGGAVVGQPVLPAHDGDVLEPLLLGCFFGPPMVMIPRACLDRVGGFDPELRLGEDWDLFLRIALAGLPVRCVPEILVRCRAHRMNTTRDLVRAAAFGRAILDRTFADPRLPARLRTQRFRTAAYKTHAIFQAGRCLRAGFWADGVALFLEAARLDPRMLSRPSSYLDLALRTLPLADQTWPGLARHADQAAALLTNVLEGLFQSSSLPTELARQRRPAWSALWMTISVVQALAHRYAVAAATLGRAFVTDPLTVTAALARAGTGRWMSIPSSWRPVRIWTTERC
jgi:glycosyltransferase involved in cell wall biosynthesis